MLTIILAEAELELVPDSIRHHTAVQSPARGRHTRAARSILDSSVHHSALTDVREGERRGRPDLVHFTLLLALDSRLNKAGGLRVVIHTRNDELIRVRPDTRLMRNYPRFIGLMEQLFRNGQVPRQVKDGEEPFFALEEGWPLSKVVAEFAQGRTVVLSEEGRVADLEAEVRAEPAGDLTMVLGAFPKGAFHADVAALSDEVISLGPDVFSVWTVASAILSFREAALGLWGAPAE